MELIYNAEDEIKCNNYSLVIRVAAIKGKYSGGLNAFVEKYRVRLNKHIAVYSSMDKKEMDKINMDVEMNEMVAPVDFIFYNPSDDIIKDENDTRNLKNIDSRAKFLSPWLSVYINKGSVILSYVEQNQEDFELITGTAVVDRFERQDDLRIDTGFRVMFKDGTYGNIGSSQDLKRIAGISFAEFEDDIEGQLTGCTVVYHMTRERKLLKLTLSCEGRAPTEDANQMDRMIQNTIHYLGEGEPRQYAIALWENLKKTPYCMTTYAVGGSHPSASSHVWALYIREKGRPKKTRDCILTSDIFYTPAKTRKAKAWQGIAEIDDWLKRHRFL